MNKYIKNSLRILIIVVVIAPVIVHFTNINFLKHYISEEVSEILGRDLLLNGDLKLKLYPELHLKVMGLQLEDAIWSESDYMLEAKSVSIKLSFKALVSGNIEISNIILDGIKINLERKNIDITNWQFPGDKNKENAHVEKYDLDKNIDTKSKINIPFNITSKISFTNVFINYRELNNNHYIKIKEFNLNQRDGTEIKIDAVYKETNISLQFKTVILGRLLESKKIPLEIKGNIGNISLKLKSNIPIDNIDKNDFKLIFDIKMDDMSTVNRLGVLKLPEIGVSELSGEILKGKENHTIILKNTKIGNTKIDGNIKYISTDKKPKIITKLMIQDLDLNIFNKVSSKENINENKKTNELFSSTPLPFEYLDIYNINVDINIKGIKHKLLDLDTFKLQANIEDSILNVKNLHLKNTQGEELNARIRVSHKSDNPEVNLILVTENIQLDKNNALKEYLSGANTHVSIKVNTKGKSIQDLMDHLNGQIVVKVGEGELDDELLKFISSNILTDLVNAINPISDNSTITKLECAAVRFDIKEGILTSDKGIVMQTDKIQIISSGIVDLHAETLEFGIKPQARKGVELNLNSLASMVKLSGKITEPSITMSFKDSAVVYSYFASGGVTFLAKSLYDTATRDETPCETAILGPVEAQ